MSKTNCVNCGSAKDINEIVCPFCGTAYFDMADIDLDGKTPCILRLRLPGTKGRTFMMKAYPVIANITMAPNYTSYRDKNGRLHSVEIGTQRSAEIRFIGVD